MKCCIDRMGTGDAMRYVTTRGYWHTVEAFSPLPREL